MRWRLVGVVAVFAPAVLAVPASGQTVAAVDRGAAIFTERCKECHEAGDERAPSRQMLAAKTPDEIVVSLTTGPMAPIAEGLTPEDKRAVAAFLTGR